MFAVIETNGASQIVIHVPHEGAEKTLPALARMLEMNATFVRTDYSSMAVVKPAMSITLGSSFTIKNSDEELAIAESGVILGDDFVNATPEVFVSNAQARKKATDEAQRLRTELSFTKDELARLRAQLEDLTRSEAA
jgi:hypothetical protein